MHNAELASSLQGQVRMIADNVRLIGYTYLYFDTTPRRVPTLAFDHGLSSTANSCGCIVSIS